MKKMVSAGFKNRQLRRKKKITHRFDVLFAVENQIIIVPNLGTIAS